MEWIISLAIVLIVIIIIVSMTIEKDNHHYYFSDCSLIEKIARVITYILIGTICIGALWLLTWCVKSVIFG